MKVAIVVRSLKIGGMERVAISLSKAFEDQGHESHLIYFKKKKKIYDTSHLKHVHFWNLDKYLTLSIVGFLFDLFARILNIFFRHSYPILKGFITSFLFKYKLSKLEKNSEPFDLIIIRGQGTFEYLWFNQDNRYIQVCENLLYPDANMNFLTKIFAKSLYNNKNIACVSNGVFESFKELEIKTNLKAKKSLVVTNPVDIEYINAASKEFIPEIKTPYIVNVGRIAPVKQLSLLIKAYDYIKSKYNIKHKLVLVGQGHDEDNIRSLISDLNLTDSVVMSGVQINPYPWIKHADLFVLSSKHEGLGMVLLEALACHTNLVVTKSPGGVRDIMKNELENFLCEPTIESLGEKIYQEITNKSPIDFQKHVEPFLPSTIVNRYITNFTSTTKV